MKDLLRENRLAEGMEVENVVDTMPDCEAKKFIEMIKQIWLDASHNDEALYKEAKIWIKLGKTKNHVLCSYEFKEDDVRMSTKKDWISIRFTKSNIGDCHTEIYIPYLVDVSNFEITEDTDSEKEHTMRCHFEYENIWYRIEVFAKKM